MKPCEILFSQGRLPAAARSQSSTSSYAASIRTDTAVPPNDADGDIDCTGADANMSHRYASNVAEHTCSAKLAEAKAELALLEAREADLTRFQPPSGGMLWVAM